MHAKNPAACWSRPAQTVIQPLPSVALPEIVDHSEDVRFSSMVEQVKQTDQTGVGRTTSPPRPRLFAIPATILAGLCFGCCAPKMADAQIDSDSKRESPGVHQNQRNESAGLIAIKCVLSGKEQNTADSMAEKPANREDAFIFDPGNRRLLAFDYSPISAKVDNSRIIVEWVDEDVNALDKTGTISEYFYAIQRSDLKATHTEKFTSNIGGFINKSYVLMEGSCQKVPLPPKTQNQSKNAI